MWKKNTAITHAHKCIKCLKNYWMLKRSGHCSSCYFNRDQFLSQLKLRNILNLRADYIQWQNPHPHNSEEWKQFQTESEYNTLNPNSNLLPANYIAADGGMQFTEHLCIAKFWTTWVVQVLNHTHAVTEAKQKDSLMRVILWFQTNPKYWIS